MSLTRRELISTAAASAAALAGTGPNERINIGLIGAGSRGKYHLDDLARLKSENLAVTAVCDVYTANREAAAARAEKEFGVKPRQTTRYQEVLESPQVDAVIIAAPDFTHSEILEQAVKAKKDAYCEKPMGVDFAEAKRAYLAVKRSDRVVQIGTQRRSDAKMIGCARFVQSGILGKVTRVDMQVHFQEPRWRRDYHHIRDTDVDWPQFLMKRSDRAFDARRFREWQLFRDYTNGIPGLWMSHYIDLVPWFLGDPYPRSVVSSGGVFLWKDGRETEDVFHALLDYPKDFLVSFAMSLTNGSGIRNEWYGTRGVLDAETMRITGAGSKGSDRVQEEIRIEPEPVEPHMQNFLRCLRSRETPRADIQAGFSHAVAGCMAAEAFRTGRRIRFDPDKLEMMG